MAMDFLDQSPQHDRPQRSPQYSVLTRSPNRDEERKMGDRLGSTSRTLIPNKNNTIVGNATTQHGTSIEGIRPPNADEKGRP